VSDDAPKQDDSDTGAPSDAEPEELRAAEQTPDEDVAGSSHAATETDTALEAMVRELAATPDGLAPDEDLTGKTLGHFRVESQLGRGGMGIVYRARDTQLGRLVALKVLPPTDVADPVARERLLGEAKAAASVDHPRLATVYEVGEGEGRQYIAMELVEGLNFHERLEQHRPYPIPVAEVRVVAEGLASALSGAHRAGLVHRDVKPENLKLTHTAGVKLLDFGLARDLRQPAASRLTEEGVVVGTSGYLSPEQLRGEDATFASDVFAFGVTLFEALTLKMPFTGKTHAERAASVLHDDAPDVRTLREAVPTALSELIARCLAKDPEDRYADGLALVVALREARERDAEESARLEREEAARVAAQLAESLPGETASESGGEAPAIVGSKKTGRMALWAAAIVAVLAGVIFALPRAQDEAAPPGPPSLDSIPQVGGSATADARFRSAVLAFYAADHEAAARGLDGALGVAPDFAPALALRLAAGHLEGTRGRQPLVERLERAAKSAADAELYGWLAEVQRKTSVDAEGVAVTAGLGPLAARGDALWQARAQDWFARMLLAMALRAEASTAERIERLDALLAQDPSPAVLYMAKVYALQRASRATEVPAVLRAGLEHNPGNPALQAELARHAFYRGDYEEAARVERERLAADPRDATARFGLAEALYYQGDESAWRKELEQLLTSDAASALASRGVLMHSWLPASRGQAQMAWPLADRALDNLEKGRRPDALAEGLLIALEQAASLEDEERLGALRKRATAALARSDLDEASTRRLRGALAVLDARAALAAKAEDAAGAVARVSALEESSFSPARDKASTVTELQARAAALAGDVTRVKELVESSSPARVADWRWRAEVLEATEGMADPSRAAWTRVLDERGACLKEHLFWKLRCRVDLVAAAVALGERAVAVDDLAVARSYAREARTVWRTPDKGLPLAEQLTVIEQAAAPQPSDATTK
jgi:serine/threonine protein kinase